ncbi:hypothetical protein EDC94DRAFT_664736 [Helicostylum pulchrum]|nr:hypothetical protein EDC94DRAFT_664736 [Helicostylum pulchrum]
MELVMDSPSTLPYNDINEKVLEWFRSVPKFQRNIPILQNEFRTVILPAAIENHTLNVEVDDSGAITNPLSIECIRNKLIQWICTASRIKKLVETAQYSTQFINEVGLNALATANGKFDFSYHKVPKRCQSFMRNLKDELNMNLLSTTTSKEREMLINIGQCQTKDEIDDLFKLFFKERNLDPMCKYIRSVLLNVDIWETKQLFIWDKVFLQDNRFISKRADCYSNTTKQFNAVNNQRVDFIWRNVNDESDYASAEEKPGRKGGRSDVRKAKSRYAIEMMTFEAEDDTLYESQSSDGSETNNEMYMDKELEEKILCDLKNIKLDEDIVTSDDWEDFIMHKTPNKRKRTP